MSGVLHIVLFFGSIGISIMDSGLSTDFVVDI